MPLKVSIIGATGYVGIELVRLLLQHPQVQISHLTTESYVGEEITTIYPHLQQLINTDLQQLNLNEITANSDVVFIALPHGKAISMSETLLNRGVKVIDLGADFRLRDPNDYRQWYQAEPAAAALLQQAVYGLAEAGYRHAIAKAQLIANPGCYPTATILALLPAIRAGIIELDSCIIDAKSGISGAGRGLRISSLYCEVAENLSPYALAGQHRHTPEIEQELSVIAKQNLLIQFSPHLVPLIRGMLVTAYAKLKQPLSQQVVHELYQQAYSDASFVRLVNVGVIPQVKHVRGSNFCDIGVFIDERTQRLIVISVIDNLIKGAAGQAIQNMNLMSHMPETMGLLSVGVYP
ncbi:N-acetyl-gamma-glutamyl-phosphate reductase [soil metagenome]